MPVTRTSRVVAIATLAILGACGSDEPVAIESSDTALGDVSAPVTLQQLDGVVLTVPADDFSGEVVRIDETGEIGRAADAPLETVPPPTPAPTMAPVLEEAGVEPQDVSPELNPLGGDDPEDDRMPDVVCMGLQDAQDEIQDRGVFFSRSVDATGEGRRQLFDRNWIVVEQSPAPGEPIGEGDAVLSVVKTDEPNDC